MDEAENYLDVLVTRGFVSPVKISAAGNIKSCKVDQEVHEFIANIARDVNLVNMNLPPEVSHHLSIDTRIELQNSHSEGCSNDIIAFLPTLAASSQWRILKVLDLEGCKGFTKNHLKSICKILLLRYLSLRNTDVTELPNQIRELQCLETLDIRETKVPVLARKAIVLPLLKYFFAGQKIAGSSDTTRSEESFPMVGMPLNIERMKNLEILSHVLVTNSDSEVAGISQLLNLRKFGVALHGKNAKLNDLFHHIGKLQRSLHSLSIRIDQLAAGGNHDASTVAALMPPRFIKSLNISGLTSGLPNLIQELHQLAKLTLTETYLNEDDLRILGKLRGLRYLRLQHNSYTKNEISFKEKEFQTLSFLLVGSSNITNMSFVTGAAPKVERIVWSFPTTAWLNGIEHLHELKEFELNGECSPDQVRHEVERHINHPVFKYNPQV